MADIIVLSEGFLFIYTSVDAAIDALQNEIVVVELCSARTIEFAVYIWTKIVNPKFNSMHD